MNYVFAPHPIASLPVAGNALHFPVRRIFCVGRNYAEHAREMGAADQAEGREPPFFFTKPGDALVGGEGRWRSAIHRSPTTYIMRWNSWSLSENGGKTLLSKPPGR